MVPSEDAPQQYKQPSRKGKRAWRKNVDVTEIQEGLEAVRDEMINGGIIAEKPSEALFTIDATGSEAIKKAVEKIFKPLKADQIIAKRSAIAALDTHKRSGTTDGVIEPSMKRRKGNGVSRQEYERLKQRAYGGATVEKDVVNTGDDASYDPWGAAPETHDARFSFLDKTKPVTAPKTLKESPVSLLPGNKALPAVLKPKAGTSYNPAFQDWDALLTSEGDKEVLAERKRLQEARDDEALQARIAAAQAEALNQYLTEDESVWEGIESDYDGAELAKKRPERKTPTQRSKVRRRKEAEREARHAAEIKKRAQQAKCIGEIAREVKLKEKMRETVVVAGSESSDEDIDDTVLRRRKFGKVIVPDRSLELVLPDELQDSLRLLKPEGNLLKDRFRNLLVSGRLETRKPIVQHKKARRSYTEKWTYKDFTIAA